MNILEALNLYGPLDLSELALRTDKRAVDVKNELKKLREKGIVFKDCAKNEKGELVWIYDLNADILYLNSKSKLPEGENNIVIYKPIATCEDRTFTLDNKTVVFNKKEQCWSSEKFISENKRLQQMIDMEFMIGE